MITPTKSQEPRRGVEDKMRQRKVKIDLHPIWPCLTAGRTDARYQNDDCIDLVEIGGGQTTITNLRRSTTTKVDR